MSFAATLGLVALITAVSAAYARWSWWRAHENARCLANGICPGCGAEKLIRDSRPTVSLRTTFKPIFRCIECGNRFDVPKAQTKQRVRKAIQARVDERLTQLLERADDDHTERRNH